MTTILRRTAMLAAFACSSAAAQNPIVPQGTGSIAGTIRDRESRQPLEGVSVFVEGSNYGAISKANGQYTILGIPPGTYTLVARQDGLATIEIANVVVRVDVKRPLDLELARYVRLGAQTNPPQRIPIVEQGQVFSPPVVCASSPGAQLGINGWQSASINIRAEGTRQVLSFQAEPVVVDVASWSVFKPGDVVQSINDEPITTRAGADAFSNPTAGAGTKVAVRRSGERVELTAYACRVGSYLNAGSMAFSRMPDTVRVGGQMVGPPQAATAGARGGRNAGSAGGRASTAPPSVAAGRAVPGTMTTITSVGVEPVGAPTLRDERDTVVRLAVRGVALQGVLRTAPNGAVVLEFDSASQQRAKTVLGAGASPTPWRADLLRDTVAQFVMLDDQQGFALRCTALCTRAIAADGSPYWRFSRPPSVTSASRSRTEAMRDAGLEPTDLVTTVNGHPITSEEAGVLLTHAALMRPLQLEITRNGERKKATLKK